MESDALLGVLTMGLFEFVHNKQILRVALSRWMEIGPYFVQVFASRRASFLAGILTYGCEKKTLTASGVTG